jgi:hypothetical protein
VKIHLKTVFFAGEIHQLGPGVLQRQIGASEESDPDSGRQQQDVDGQAVVGSHRDSASEVCGQCYDFSKYKK